MGAQPKNVAFVGMTRAVYDRRIMTTIRILFFLLTAVVSPAQTPEPAVSLADTQQRTLTSAKIGQRYELLVSLPAGYAKSGQSYPVLYVLDGWHFPLMAFIQENNVTFEADAPSDHRQCEPWCHRLYGAACA